MKIGDKIEVFLHGTGVVSSEKSTIVDITDKYIEIEDTNCDDENFKFDKKTGRCLNGSSFFGFSRTIKL